MFNEEEVQFLTTTLINTRFQPGQSKQIIMAEHLIKKLNANKMAVAERLVNKVIDKVKDVEVKEEKTA